MDINVFCRVNFRQVLFEIIDSGLVEDFQITFVTNFTILKCLETTGDSLTMEGNLCIIVSKIYVAITRICRGAATKLK
jgi:hypothetical protein